MIYQKNWSIVPKQINTTWGMTSKTYAGNDLTFELFFSGLVSKDLQDLTATDFSYNITCNDISFNSDSVALIFSAKKCWRLQRQYIIFR